MVQLKKGGSPASDFVMRLNANNSNNSNNSKKSKKLNELRFLKCNTKSKLGVSKVSSGGSPLSKAVNFFVKRRSNCRKNPGVFPKKPNDYNLLKLSPPVYKNGVLQGGSAWKAVHNSGIAFPSQKDKELFKKFSKDAKVFIQRTEDIINGPMFKPFAKSKKKANNNKNNSLRNNRNNNKSKKQVRPNKNNRVEYGRVNGANNVMNSRYAPAKNNSAAAKNNSAAAKNNSAAAKNNSAAAKNNSAPAKNNSAPAKNNSAAAKNNSAAAKNNSAAAKNNSAAAKNNSPKY